MLHVPRRPRLERQQLPQRSLPIQQRLLAQIATIEPKQIEDVETERPPAPHQLVEQRPTIRPGTYDLAIQDGGPAGQVLGNGLSQRLKCLERIPVGPNPTLVPPGAK
jgi:hypothetical protein